MARKTTRALKKPLLKAPEQVKKPLNFLQEVQIELKKIIWPARKQVIKLTAIVVSVSIIVALYIGALDITFTKLVNLILIK